MSRTRIGALDLTKGVLVVLMVVYHSLNYSTERQLGFNYLAFLPPSFILITGFLVCRAYLTRTSTHDAQIYIRLLTRGIRLLVLFTFLNIVAQWLIPDRARGRMPGLEFFWAHWYGVYITGNARLATFEVLLPIAYFLLLSPVLVFAGRQALLALPFLAAVMLTIVWWQDSQGIGSANVQLVTCGVVGTAIGCLPLERLRAITMIRMVSVVAYGVFMALSAVFGSTFLIQLFGACLALTLIFSFCTGIRVDSWCGRRLELLGRYSLFGYILQIVALYVLAHLWSRPEPFSLQFLSLFTVALLLTEASVEILDWIRKHSKWIDSVYTAVFA